MGFFVEIITLCPELWPTVLGPTSGLIGKAFGSEAAELRIRNLRDYGHGPHRQVDDSPFGGGAGMVLMVDPLRRAIAEARSQTPGPVLLLTPRGKPFSQKAARALASGPGMTLVCGRYEGFDERVRGYVDGEICLGDFVLSAGDPAAWAVVDAVVRLLPGVLGNPESIEEESFGQRMLEYPQYTRPAVYEDQAVPDILRSGDHGKIAKWRQEQAEALTRRHRPDLLDENA